MREFILWSNCNDCCKFCWQQKKHDLTTFLNEQEMIESIETTMLALNKINDGDDVLLVGGEILNHYFDSVDNKLYSLIDKCVDMIKENKIRFLYINTNLMYKDIRNLIYLLSAFTFNKIETRLKFTTSYDVYGRFFDFHTVGCFELSKTEGYFFQNLRFVNNFEKFNVVINSIITKQLVEKLDDNYCKYQYKTLSEDYPVVKYINFIPYIPVVDDRSMDVAFKDIIKVLAAQEKIQPGYINHYIDDFDFNQNKVLYEYHKDKGYVECTAKYAECHHNENFKKVLGDECYICKLKEVFR